MEAQTCPKQKSNKKKQQVHNGDIVFIKQGSVQTVPSLSKRLETVTDPVVGLQYIWEYRSPSRTVPPHYQCRLCNVPLLLNEMVCHIIGWKHCFKYIQKHTHPEKMSCQQEDLKKDKKVLKAIAVEVEQAEGRGQIKVLFREPCDVPVFQNMKSAFPSAKGPGAPSGLLGPVPGGFHPGGGILPTPYPEDLPPQGGMMGDFSPNMHVGDTNIPMSELFHSDLYGMMGDRISDRMMEGPDSMPRLPNSRSMHTAPDGFGMGPRREDMGRQYPDNLFMNGSDRMMSANGPESSNTLQTLLRYLDSFRIECEDDAQIVLKITQKLADVLMEYRLRGSRLNSSLLPLSSDRFFDSMSGPSTF